MKKMLNIKLKAGYWAVLSLIICHSGFADTFRFSSYPSTNFWQTNWPPITNAGPKLVRLTNVKAKDGIISCDLGFQPEGGKHLKDIAGLGGRKVADWVRFQLVETRDGGGVMAHTVVITEISPPQFDPDQTTYHASLSVQGQQPAASAKMSLSAHFIPRQALEEYRLNSLLWTQSALARLEALKPINSEPSFIRYFKNLKNHAVPNKTWHTREMSAGTNLLIATINRLVVTNNIVVKTNSVLLTNWAGLNPTSAINVGAATNAVEFHLNRFSDVLFQVVASAATRLTNYLNAAEHQEGRPADRLDELGLALAARYADLTYFGHDTRGARSSTLEADSGTDQLQVKFSWEGRILGFATVIDRIELLPGRLVTDHLGKGIANHFHVVRIRFVNTNKHDILLYGDQVRLNCTYREFSWRDKNSYKFLMEKIPDESASPEPMGSTDDKKVEELRKAFLATEKSILLLWDGFIDKLADKQTAQSIADLYQSGVNEKKMLGCNPQAVAISDLDWNVLREIQTRVAPTHGKVKKLGESLANVMKVRSSHELAKAAQTEAEKRKNEAATQLAELQLLVQTLTEKIGSAENALTSAQKTESTAKKNLKKNAVVQREVAEADLRKLHDAISRQGKALSNCAKTLKKAEDDVVESSQRVDYYKSQLDSTQRTFIEGATSAFTSLKDVTESLQKVRANLNTAITNSTQTFADSTNGMARVWRGGRWSGPIWSATSGTMVAKQQRMEFAPLPVSLLLLGQDKRDFDTWKQRNYRVLGVLANAATAVIPFINTPTYSQYAGVGSGIIVPTVKELFGDATPMQRQAFNLESLPQYLELKRGQSVNKLVYLPRHGFDRMKADRILFISEVGDSQSATINYALIQNVTQPGTTEPSLGAGDAASSPNP